MGRVPNPRPAVHRIPPRRFKDPGTEQLELSGRNPEFRSDCHASQSGLPLFPVYKGSLASRMSRINWLNQTLIFRFDSAFNVARSLTVLREQLVVQCEMFRRDAPHHAPPPHDDPIPLRDCPRTFQSLKRLPRYSRPC